MNTKDFSFAIFLLIIQQLIVASSSLWITQFILSISENQPELVWLWLYLFSLILPYLPGALALIEVGKAQIRNCVIYIQKFAELYPGKIVKWSDHEQKSFLSSILTAEAFPTFNSYIEYLYHLTSSGLNVILNLLVLSFLIDSSLILSYIIGVLLSSIILFFQKNSKERLSLKAQERRIQWASLLLKAWDNILLNNAYNLTLWNSQAKIKGKNLSEDTITLEKFNQFVGILMAFALIFPSLALIIYLAISNLHNAAFLATITVLLPRLFQILSYSYELLFLISGYPMQKAKLNTVLAVIKPLTHAGDANVLLSRIEWEKLHAKKSSDESINAKELLSLTFPSQGRITLIGENGSGKTSLLLYLKAKLREQAFYLPSRHELLFEGVSNKLSTGQLASQILDEIKRNVSSPVILLDEWDANLDSNNRKRLSSLIDDLSQVHCVIEILHMKHHHSSQHESISRNQQNSPI